MRDGAGIKQPVRAVKGSLGHRAHGVLPQDGAALRKDGWFWKQEIGESLFMDFTARSGMKVDGTLGRGKPVRGKENKKLGMGKESQMAYGMIERWQGCVSEVNTWIGRR